MTSLLHFAVPVTTGTGILNSLIVRIIPEMTGTISDHTHHFYDGHWWMHTCWFTTSYFKLDRESLTFYEYILLYYTFLECLKNAESKEGEESF